MLSGGPARPRTVSRALGPEIGLKLAFLDLTFLDLTFLDLTFLDLTFLDLTFLDRERQRSCVKSHRPSDETGSGCRCLALSCSRSWLDSPAPRRPTASSSAIIARAATMTSTGRD